jgi:hypothetical protein
MMFFRIVDLPTLEALACREALALVDDLGLRRVIASLDCKQVVQEISDGTGGAHEMVTREIGKDVPGSLVRFPLYMKEESSTLKV